MVYKDPAKQRAYQNNWTKQRRFDWLRCNGPCVDCGSWDRLEVDHKDAREKVTHRVWSWSLSRRSQELDKCVVRCHWCHEAKTTLKFERANGTRNSRAKLQDIDVRVIRHLHRDGFSYPVIAKMYNTNRDHIGQICRNVTWKHVM